MAISLRFYGSIALLTLAAAACQTTPRLLGRDTQVTLGPLERLNPSDIAVAPIRLTKGAEKAPVGALRRAAQVGLARRRYSPLSTSLVDATVEAASSSMAGIAGEAGAPAMAGGPMEASYAPGDLGEDAVLQITITRWDDRNWAVRRRVGVGIEARMVDPADPFGPALWAGRLDRDFEPPTSVAGTMIASKAQEVIAGEIFRELMARMPSRDIDPAGLNEIQPPRGGEQDGDVESPWAPEGAGNADMGPEPPASNNPTDFEGAGQ